MSSRRDLLAECNTSNEAIPAFQDNWCRRCITPECTRSLFGQTRFDLRVNSWEDRLFKNPPRLDTSDPRYAGIASKKFLSIDVGAPPELRSWVDPVAEPEPEPQPEPEVQAVSLPEVTPKVEVSVKVESSVTPEKKIEQQPKVESKQPPNKDSTVRPELLSMNSPSQGGKVLPGVKNPQPMTRDPWAAPEPIENVVPVGGRVKFRGSGV